MVDINLCGMNDEIVHNNLRIMTKCNWVDAVGNLRSERGKGVRLTRIAANICFVPISP